MLKIMVVGLSIMAILTSSCAFTPQKVHLNPEIGINSDSIGQGKIITVNSVDERATSRIGKRGLWGADITTNEDLAKIVESKISEGLQKRGFDTKGASTSNSTELRVEIRNLEYSLSMAIVGSILKTESSLKGVCKINGKTNYERLYRGGSEEHIFTPQFAENNEAHINKALSEVIKTLLNDEELCRCLAQ